MDAALGRDRQVDRLLGQEEESENKLGHQNQVPKVRIPWILPDTCPIYQWDTDSKTMRTHSSVAS